jgi:hypothetical protein
MKARHRTFRRGGVFYAHDSDTRRQRSLGTRDKTEAARLLSALNESSHAQSFNLQLARVCLTASTLFVLRWRPSANNSKAVHHAYARKSELRLPSLEDYESAKADGKILVFEPQANGFAKPAGGSLNENATPMMVVVLVMAQVVVTSNLWRQIMILPSSPR